MAENSFSNMLGKSFNGAAGDKLTPEQKRTRIDARTVGYPVDYDDHAVQWLGMSPAPGKGDKWLVVHAQEEPNKYLTQIRENEKLVDIVKVIGEDEPLSFEEAVEKIAVWELARMMKGKSPAKHHDREDLGRHYYRDLVMRRGYLISSTGQMEKIGDIFPAARGKFLQSDIDAYKRYRSELTGADVFDELMRSHDPMVLGQGSTLDDDLEAFGEIALFEGLQFFTDILVEYARVKLAFIDEFFEDPTADINSDVYRMMNDSGFFDDGKIAQLNQLKTDLTAAIFRFFEVDESDWDKELDFDDPNFRRELYKNPGAVRTLEILTEDVTLPLDKKESDAMLEVAARAIVYFQYMLQDSPRKDVLERKGIYSQTDIDDLLNFLDLLEIKFSYVGLAKASFVLPGTAAFKELKGKKEDFERRVDDLKYNMRESGGLSPERERQVDEFIKAKSRIFLLDRIAALPDRIQGARDYIASELLPDKDQMKLALGNTEQPKGKDEIAAPSRQTRRLWQGKEPKL